MSKACSSILTFLARLRSEGRLVFLCLHPNEPCHLEILDEICERRNLFVFGGAVTQAPSFAALLEDERVLTYLGDLAAPHLRRSPN